jgi:repressor LexA
MRTPHMNERAREILHFIRSFAREKGFPPTIREIGKAFGIASTNGVRYHLTILEKAGYLQRRSRISRGTTSPSNTIPLLGRVAAGSPILAEQNFEGSLEPAQMFGDPQGLFALRVRGDSMIDAGIHSGDYVIVRQQEQATSGDMVVALLGDEATVKYYKPRGQRVELVAANQRYAPIVVEPEAEFRILGVVRGVVRTVGG